jgi:hypothetical protein
VAPVPYHTRKERSVYDYIVGSLSGFENEMSYQTSSIGDMTSGGEILQLDSCTIC